MAHKPTICASAIWRLLAVSCLMSALSAGMLTPASAADAPAATGSTLGPVDPNAAAPEPGGLTMAAIAAETGSYNSNALLSVANPVLLYGSTTSPEFILKDTSPTSLMSVDGRLDKNVFNKSSFDSTDLHANSILKTQNERWSLGFVQLTDYDTTRTSELTSFGLTNTAVRHLGLSEAPQVTFNMTPADALSVSASVASSHYASTIYTDYMNYAVTPTYSHKVDALNTFQLITEAQRYQTMSGIGQRIDTLGPSLGWQTILSPRFSANASAGAQTTRSYVTGTPPTSWTWQYVFSGGLTFQGDQDTIKANAARSQYPYGNGTEALQTSFNITEAHNLTTRTVLNLGANYQTSTYPTPVAGSIKSLLGGSGGLSYHATETLDVTGNYQFEHESVLGSSQTAQDHTVTLNLTYHPKLWTLLH